MAADKQNAEWSARLKALGVVIKLGSDLFGAPDFATAAAMAANSSHSLLKFKSSALAEITGGKVRIVGQYGTPVVDEHSEAAEVRRELLERLEIGDAPLTLRRNNVAELDSETGGVLERILEDDDDSLLVLPLSPPQFLGNPGFRLVWLICFSGEVPAFASSMAGVLQFSFAAALYCHRCCRPGTGTRLRKHFSRKRLFGLFTLLVAAALMFVPVRESVNTEFTLKAPRIVSAYAWFDGPISRCLRQDGAVVKAGETIALYDTSALQFRLAAAENQLAETRKAYELESSAAFLDKNHLGQAKLMEARLAGAEVAVREAKWYLKHAAVKAPAAGVLALADGRAELLQNKAVRTGDRLFDIYGGKGVIAEIRVDERDSSILAGLTGGTLFLYTSPDRGLKARILDIRKYPELTERRNYSYIVLAEIEGTPPEGVRYGMRGIAKLYGRRVSLGYYLFKNLVIYLRWL